MSELQAIDLTPTWRSCANIYIAALENPTSPETAKELARDEIRRMGAIIDSFTDAKLVRPRHEPELF